MEVCCGKMNAGPRGPCDDSGGLKQRGTRCPGGEVQYKSGTGWRNKLCHLVINKLYHQHGQGNALYA